MIQTSARNVDLGEMLGILKDQHEARLDVVASPQALKFEGGNLVLSEQGDPILSDEGVTATDRVLVPSEDFDAQAATALRIPLPYFRRMRAEAPELLDTNVNHWLARRNGDFMVRSFRDGDTGGTARALLSSGYGAMDHLDFLTGTLTAVRDTGQPVDIRALNLDDRHLTMDIVSPAVEALAPALLSGYVSPFTGQRGEDLPVIRAGIRFRNSETGHGKLFIGAFAEVQVCTNGMTMTKFADGLTFERTHRGRRQGIGAINWSAETSQARVRALVAEATDVVRHFLDPVWFKERIAEIERAAQKPIDGADAVATIARVANRLDFTDSERDSVFAAFIEGRQLTNGGVVQAITAAAQRTPDPTRALRMEDRALEALLLV